MGIEQLIKNYSEAKVLVRRVDIDNPVFAGEHVVRGISSSPEVYDLPVACYELQL